MFSALRQGSLVYILEKENGLVLKNGRVATYTSPQFTNNIYPNNQQPFGFVNITVDVDGKSVEFNNLPASQNVAPYNGGMTIVSESKDAIITEVENSISNSKTILNSREYHEKLINDGENILKELNPHFAKEKERDEEINSINARINGVDEKLNKLLSLLSNDAKQ